MIKVPATDAGVRAIEELTARGVNVNVTLLFSVARYEQVIDAYLAGLERRLAAGEPVDSIVSVASFFVSRVDTKADAVLPAGSDLRGRVAVANAQRAYLLPPPLRGRTLAPAARCRGERPAPALGQHRDQETPRTPTASTSKS
jgi:transaldolase